jgi:hypothetical protein
MDEAIGDEDIARFRGTVGEPVDGVVFEHLAAPEAPADVGPGPRRCPRRCSSEQPASSGMKATAANHAGSR